MQGLCIFSSSKTLTILQGRLYCLPFVDGKTEDTLNSCCLDPAGSPPLPYACRAAPWTAALSVRWSYRRLPRGIPVELLVRVAKLIVRLVRSGLESCSSEPGITPLIMQPCTLCHTAVFWWVSTTSFSAEDPTSKGPLCEDICKSVLV